MLNLTFSFDGIEFSLTHFPCICQTWESEENSFQESEFLETNGADIPHLSQPELSLFPSSAFWNVHRRRLNQ